jgi:16S rRNA processing protein RimM
MGPSGGAGGAKRSEKIDVGFVLRAHGIRGALRVRAQAELDGLASLDIGGRSYRLLSAQRDKEDWLVTLAGVDDRNAAEALRGQPVRLDRDAIAVAEDELLVADLVGCTLVDLAGAVLGEVTGSFDSGAHEVLEVRRPAEHGGGEFMVPLVDAIVTAVDVEARRIVCDPPPGLIDLDEADSAGGRGEPEEGGA